MPQIVQQADFYECFAISVCRSDRPERLPHCEGQAYLIGNVIVGLRNVGYEGIRVFDPPEGRSSYLLP